MNTTKTFKRLLLAFFILAGLSSCTDEIDLQTKEGPKRLIVEGNITDINQQHQVKLTYTTAYTNYGGNPPATGATVYVSDSEDNEYSFSETEPGIYVSSSSWQGTYNAFYTLHIILEGKTYRSTPQELNAPTVIDSLFSLTNDEFPFGGATLPEGNYMFFNYVDPIGQGDFYRARFTVRDTVRATASDILLIDDLDYKEGAVLTPRPIVQYQLEPGDELTMELISITREHWEFLEVFTSLANTGGPFDTPPAPLQGNVFNVADENELILGFFAATSSTSRTASVPNE